jgi:uncharacterized protein (DUF488 family)
MAMAQPFYTIGHSNRSFDDFVDLLQSAEVTWVMDVRTVPRSRTNPQYNQDVLPEALATFEIGYEHVTSLGGLVAARVTYRPVSTPSGKMKAFTTARTTR